MKRGFYWLTGDINWIDYGGKWIRQVGPACYHVISFDSWENLDSSAVDTFGKYTCDLSEINLGEISHAQITRALDYIGIDASDPPDWLTPDSVCQVMVEACHSYGLRAPLWDCSGNNAHKLIREAKRTSREMEDPDTHADAMSRPVNAIGSTALEFMRGDLTSPILRGLAEGDPRAELMARMGMLRS